MKRRRLTKTEKIDIGATRLTQPRLSMDALDALAARYGTTVDRVRSLRKRYARDHACPAVSRGRIPRLTPGGAVVVEKLIRLRRLLSNKSLARAFGCGAARISAAASAALERPSGLDVNIEGSGELMRLSAAADALSEAIRTLSAPVDEPDQLDGEDDSKPGGDRIAANYDPLRATRKKRSTRTRSTAQIGILMRVPDLVTA
jgi:hypothetical protein